MAKGPIAKDVPDPTARGIGRDLLHERGEGRDNASHTNVYEGGRGTWGCRSGVKAI